MLPPPKPWALKGRRGLPPSLISSPCWVGGPASGRLTEQTGRPYQEGLQYFCHLWEGTQTVVSTEALLHAMDSS